MASDTPGKKTYTCTSDDPEYVDCQLMYSHTKQIEIQMDELKSENTALQSLGYDCNELDHEIAAVLRKVLSNYFDGFKALLPLPSMEHSENSTASSGMPDKPNCLREVTIPQRSIPSSQISQPLVTTNDSLTP